MRLVFCALRHVDTLPGRTVRLGAALDGFAVEGDGHEDLIVLGAIRGDEQHPVLQLRVTLITDTTKREAPKEISSAAHRYESHDEPKAVGDARSIKHATVRQRTDSA